ncbi:MAG: glycosyltransferase family 39 protein [Dokdonella sp.]|nr:glycosyltransferase family 39 protein [Dokdonella sp.]
MSFDKLLRHELALPLLLTALLSLPVVFLLAPLPIDETRYLAVAWEMRLGGEYLVPHLNGDLYWQKPPLLFWLINAGWTLTGVHAWTARALTVIYALASLVLVHALTLRLGATRESARNAAWLLAGAIYFALFSNMIMFDVLLTVWVLLALLGVCDLVDARYGRGILVAGVAIGLGVLSKGPVMLLLIGAAALLAPWWAADRLQGRRARYFGMLAVAILLGAAIALAWAIPAAIHGGEEYRRAIFLNQTLDRINGVKGTSAHRRPLWWYLLVFPAMLLPWPLVVRGNLTRMRALLSAVPLRFALAWLLPTFIVFSLVSGKQPHYLLPLIPAVAIVVAIGLEAQALRLRTGLLGVVLVVLGILLATVHAGSFGAAIRAYASDLSPWWGIVIAGLGVGLLSARSRITQPLAPALAVLVFALLVKLAIVQGPGTRFDITPMARQIAALQARGETVAHVGRHHGVYEFAGRLTKPLPTFETLHEFEAWAREHPDAYVATFYRRFRFRAPPLFTQPFRGVEASLWKVSDGMAAGIDPNISHSGDEADENADD